MLASRSETIDRWVFATFALRQTGLLIVATLAFPYLLTFVANASGAYRGGAAGALAAALGTYLKPFIYILFCGSMVRPAMRRAMTLGMTGIIGFGIFVLLLGDMGYALAVAAQWSGSPGGSDLGVPWLLLSAAVAIVTLILLREGSGNDPATSRWGVAYAVWLALLSGLAAPVLLALAGSSLALWRHETAALLSTRILEQQTIIAAFLSPNRLSPLFFIASLWLIVVDRMGQPSTVSPKRLAVDWPSPHSALVLPNRPAAFGRRAGKSKPRYDRNRA